MNLFNDFNLIHALMTLPGVIIGFAFHEFAHAYASDRLGDPTPRNMGRLTLSPMVHIDPFGLILIFLAGFGWAKPVQVNPKYYKNPRSGDILVSAAGPAANLLVAVLFAALLKLLLLSGLISANTGVNLAGIFIAGIGINIMLFLFNLLPIPTLDGFHILANLVPYRYYNIIGTLERYSMIILVVVIVSKLPSYLIGGPGNYIFASILRAFGI